MRKLAMGGDRDGLLILLEQDGQRLAEYVEKPSKQRNDHLLVTDFLKRSGVDWSQIDRFILLAVPHSKTTVRVDATLLGSAGWYYGRPLAMLSVESLNVASADELTLPESVSSEFDPQVLAELL